MSDTLLYFNDVDINLLVEKYLLPVVNCWSLWCDLCKMARLIIEELITEMQGKIVFGKFNIDENRATPARYGIMGIPAHLVFKNVSLVENKFSRKYYKHDSKRKSSSKNSPHMKIPTTTL